MIVEQSRDYYYLTHGRGSLRIKHYLGKSPHYLPQDVKILYDKIVNRIFTTSDFLSFYQLFSPWYQKKLSLIVSTLVTQPELQANDDFIYDFVYHSNKSEGSKIAKEDFLKIVHHQISGSKNKNEIQEVKNSQRCRNYLMGGGFVWNEASIKKLHAMLTDNLLNEQGDPYLRGYKKYNNIVGNALTVDRNHVSEEMKGLLDWYRRSKKTLFPLQLAFDFHYKFERIHPFVDGNGRIGRLLMNKILVSAGYIPLTIFSENRVSYFRTFDKVIDKGMVSFYEFLIDQYTKTLKL